MKTQSIIHEILYIFTFIYIIYNIYKSTDNYTIKYIHILYLLFAIIIHSHRLFTHFSQILQFTINNKQFIIFDIIKYSFILFLLFNIHSLSNIHFYLLILSIIDIILYYYSFHLGLYHIQNFDIPMLIISSLIILLNLFYKPHNNFFQIIFYPFFFHSINLLIKYLQ
jgi:hypothetical protein